ncbi:hypothetical protein CHISP_1228 [Chitinispirillum alkaliphilum]|nr:hypothetical protein CHISP_1228 [Chitinispirillum alkaliphilum]
MPFYQFNYLSVLFTFCLRKAVSAWSLILYRAGIYFPIFKFKGSQHPEKSVVISAKPKMKHIKQNLAVL